MTFKLRFFKIRHKIKAIGGQTLEIEDEWKGGSYEQKDQNETATSP